MLTRRLIAFPSIAIGLGVPGTGAAEPVVLEAGESAETAAASVSAAGGTVVLGRGHHPNVVVRARPRGTLTFVAARGATVGRLLVLGATRVRFVGVTITPRGAH